MTPTTREPRRVPFSARHLFESPHTAAFVFLFLIFFFSSAPASSAVSLNPSQDPNSKPAPTPPTQQPASAPAKPSAEAPKEALPLKKAINEKKVITEDDLAELEKPLTFSDVGDEENNSLCDLACEAELKAEVGITSERELEFRNQLTLARHEIGDDHAWNSALNSALEAARQYCDLQRQKAEILSKGDSSGYARSLVNSRYAKRESDLSSQYRNFAGYVTQRIETVQRFAPLRAAVMQHEWNDFSNRACPDFKLP